MKIVIIGGRGNGTVVASTIEDCKKAGQNIHCIGFLNDDEKEINGYPVVGKIRNKDWEKLPNDVMFIYTMSKVKLAYERHMMLKNLAIPLSRFANVVHPTAIVSNQATMKRKCANGVCSIRSQCNDRQSYTTIYTQLCGA